jgi:hypothetical protein
MKTWHVLFISMLFIPCLKAQDTLIITSDSFSFLKTNYKRSYQLMIRDSQKKKHEGYIYQLSEHSITLSNINPRKMDSANTPGLILTTLHDTNILDIKLMHRHGILLSITLPVIPAFLAGYYTWPPDPVKYDPISEIGDRILSIGTAVLVYVAIFVPSIIAATANQTNHVLSSES